MCPVQAVEGTTAIASSKPVVIKGGTGQPAGDIVIREGTGNDTEWGEQTRNISVKVEITTDTGSGISSDTPTGIAFSAVPVVAGANVTNVSFTNNVLTFAIRGSNNTNDKIEITNIKYNVASTGVADGDVKLAIESGFPCNPITVNNATVKAEIKIGKNSTPEVIIGQTNQTAGGISIQEPSKGTLASGMMVSLKILTAGVTFSSEPEANITAGDLTLTSVKGVLFEGKTKATWAVDKVSTTTASTIVFKSIKYDVAQTITTANIEVAVTTTTDINISPSSVVNATARTMGTTSISTSRPVVTAKNSQAAGDIKIMEKGFCALLSTTNSNEVKLTIKTTGVTFQSSPKAEASGGGLKLEKSESTLATDKRSATWKVITSSSGSAGAITINNIAYSISTSTVEGDIKVEVSGSAGVSVEEISNAWLGSPASLAVSSKPYIIAGINDQRAGNIIITEKSKGLLVKDSQIKVSIAKSGDAKFSILPKVMVTSGDIAIGVPTLVGEAVVIPITSTSTVPSEIVLSGIKYNVTKDATGTDLQVDVSYIGNPTKAADSTVKIGTIANAYVLALPAASTYKDVNRDFWAFPYVEVLAAKSIISGYQGNFFKPNNNLNRAEFAKLVVIAKKLTLVSPENPSFKDVPSTHWAYAYIETAKQAGIISGYPGDIFKPSVDVTRAEMIKSIIAASGLPINTSGTTFFDVLYDHWAFNFIMTAMNKGMVSGYPDGSFRPKANLTRAEAAKMIFWML